MTQNLIERPASPTIHLTAGLLIVLFVAAVVGSFLAKVEIVARGEGRIIPTKRVQLVQPLMDGKIAAILVAEGQAVQRGDLLISLDTSLAESEIKRIEAEIDRHSQDRAVALSVLEPLATHDPQAAAFIESGLAVLHRLDVADDPDRVAMVRATLTALQDQIGEIDAQHARIRKAELAQTSRLEKAKSEQEIIAKRFSSAESLRRGGTISEHEYMERLRVNRAAEGDVTIADRQLSEMYAEAEAVNRRRASAISEARSTYRKQLSTADIALGSLKAEFHAARERLMNLSLRAPQDGHVENLSVYTLGSFVNAGATLLSIVPTGSDIELEAFFDNRDIGFLEPRQRAFIKIDAFPAERFGLVRGRVASVGADAREQAGRWVYAVRLKLDQTSIRAQNRDIEFVPGMTAVVDVVTGERRLLSYFFEPIIKALQDSFGEQ